MLAKICIFFLTESRLMLFFLKRKYTDTASAFF